MARLSTVYIVNRTMEKFSILKCDCEGCKRVSLHSFTHSRLKEGAVTPITKYGHLSPDENPFFKKENNSQKQSEDTVTPMEELRKWPPLRNMDSENEISMQKRDNLAREQDRASLC